MSPRKPILCLDFDGVLHSYSSGWKGAGRCPDEPVPGAVDFLYEATKHFRVMIYSSRSRSLAGRAAMKRWLRKHFDLPLTFSPDHNADFLYEAVEFPWFKPPALLTIDDRALTFDGTWPTMAALKDFKPWNKRTPDQSAEAEGVGDAARQLREAPTLPSREELERALREIVAVEFPPPNTVHSRQEITDAVALIARCTNIARRALAQGADHG